jgi:hypothetical protein
MEPAIHSLHNPLYLPYQQSNMWGKHSLSGVSSTRASSVIAHQRLYQCFLLDHDRIGLVLHVLVDSFWFGLVAQASAFYLSFDLPRCRQVRVTIC